MEEANKQKWIAAIDRCLKQDKYGGSKNNCQLCLESTGMQCYHCICYMYYRFINIVDMEHVQPCVAILRNSKNSNIVFHKKWVRKNLKAMRNWLVTGKRKRIRGELT